MIITEVEMGNHFGYMRISTKEERGLQKYARQENALEKYAQKEKIDYLLVLREDESGKSFSGRSQWKKLEKLVQKGDVIVRVYFLGVIAA